MKILMIAHHGCVRVWKEAHILMNEGHEVSVLSQRITEQEVTRWKSFSTYHDVNQLMNSVRMYDAAGYDVFHVHNEPDWIVSATLKSTRKPVVFDIHDLESARIGSAVPKEEIELMRSVDGIINVSQGMDEDCKYWHNPKCPMEVIYTYTPEKMLAPKEQVLSANRIPNSIVYEGGISEPFAVPESAREYGGRGNAIYRSFRDFGSVFRELVNAGMQVHIHPTELTKEVKMYELLGCIVHNPTPFVHLIPEFLRYDWSFVGCGFPVPLLDKAMPNKLFEPISGGTAPVVYCAREAERFVLKNEIGQVLDTLNHTEIQHKLTSENARKHRERWLQIRDSHTMESQYDKLMKLYEEAIRYNGNRNG